MPRKMPKHPVETTTHALLASLKFCPYINADKKHLKIVAGRS